MLLISVPAKVFSLYETDATDTPRTADLSCTDTDGWWQNSDLRKLQLNSNQLSALDPRIGTLSALTVLDVSMHSIIDEYDECGIVLGEEMIFIIPGVNI